MPLKICINYGTIDQAAPLFWSLWWAPKKASCPLRRGSREMRDTQAGIRAKRFWENALSKTNSGANSKGVILAPTHNDLKASFYQGHLPSSRRDPGLICKSPRHQNPIRAYTTPQEPRQIKTQKCPKSRSKPHRSYVRFPVLRLALTP